MNIIEKFNIANSDDTEEKTKGIFKAIATTWGARETNDGRRYWYTKEVFKPIVEAVNKGELKIPIYYNHNDKGIPVGQIQEMNITETGLEVNGQLFTYTQTGKDLYQIMINENLITDVSSSVYSNDIDYVTKEGRVLDFYKATQDEIKEAYIRPNNAQILEISITDRPANTKASITALETKNNDDEIKSVVDLINNHSVTIFLSQ